MFDEPKPRNPHLLSLVFFLCVTLFGILFFSAILEQPASALNNSKLPSDVKQQQQPNNNLVPSDDGRGLPEEFLKLYDTSQRKELASRYVFVRGCAKSGTSWLKMLIDLHYKVHLLPYELQLALLDDGIKHFTSKPWQASSEPYRTLVRNWSNQLIYQILELARQEQHDAIYVGEKSPKPVEPLINGAKYVYVIRDGRDVLVSLFAHRVRIGGFTNWCSNDEMFGTNELTLLAEINDWDYFQKNPAKLLSYEPCVRQLISNWKRRLTSDLTVLNAADPTLPKTLGVGLNFVHDTQHARASKRKYADQNTMVYAVRYEDMVANTEKIRTNIYSWLGLDSEDAGNLAKYTLPLKDLAEDSPYRPQDLFFRKGTPGEWKIFFTNDVKKWFKDEAGQLLIDLGYEKDLNW